MDIIHANIHVNNEFIELHHSQMQHNTCKNSAKDPSLCKGFSEQHVILRN